MATLFESVRKFFRYEKRLLTGEIVLQEDIKVGSWRNAVSLQLKRERRSRKEYFVLAAATGEGTCYILLELDEFDRFIEAADDIRASQTGAGAASFNDVPTLGLLDMFSKGQVLRRTEISVAYVPISLEFRRDRRTAHEYVVLATVDSWQLCKFELCEFHRFVAAAKRVRAARHDFLLQQA